MMNLINIALDLGKFKFNSNKDSVLIVEDNTCTAIVISSAADIEGFRPIVASSGEEAIGIMRLNGKNIKAALIDIMLPGIDGWKVRQVIQDECPGLKICMLSTDANSFDRIPAGEAVMVFLKNGHTYNELFRNLKK